MSDKQAAAFDRSAEDVGNILHLEHVNLTVPDLELAHLFYVTYLGFTRDPYMDFGTFNFWVNAGSTQIHLPRGEPQRWRGTIALTVPSLEALDGHLRFVGKAFDDTQFEVDKSEADCWRVRCPWGNQFELTEPGSSGLALGISAARYQVAPGSADGIARFYETAMGASSEITAGRASVQMSAHQRLVFEETRAEIDAYDGHHLAIYLADFSGPHAWLAERGLITEESDQWQYRFVDIVDPDSGKVLCQLEHEVRSLTHPLYNRNLVNRNAEQTIFKFEPGREAFVPAPNK